MVTLQAQLSPAKTISATNHFITLSSCSTFHILPDEVKVQLRKHFHEDLKSKHFVIGQNWIEEKKLLAKTELKSKHFVIGQNWIEEKKLSAKTELKSKQGSTCLAPSPL